MTATVEQRCTSAPASMRGRGRLIGVGIGDVDRDEAPLRWAEHLAVAGVDAVHVVHAYVPLRLDGCTWPPVARARDIRRLHATRVVGQAVQRLRTERPGVLVNGSAVAGLPPDVLVEFSSVVDLIVLGRDHVGGGVPRSVTARVRDSARCPVAVVPGDAPMGDDRPVTLLIGDEGLEPQACDLAVDLAQRGGGQLQVARPWSALHAGEVDGADWLANQQERLDAQLASWNASRPQVAVTARIEVGARWAEQLCAASSVIVTAAASADRLDVADTGGCVVVTVPPPTAMSTRE